MIQHAYTFQNGTWTSWSFSLLFSSLVSFPDHWLRSIGGWIARNVSRCSSKFSRRSVPYRRHFCTFPANGHFGTFLFQIDWNSEAFSNWLDLTSLIWLGIFAYFVFQFQLQFTWNWLKFDWIWNFRLGGFLRLHLSLWLFEWNVIFIDWHLPNKLHQLESISTEQISIRSK